MDKPSNFFLERFFKSALRDRCCYQCIRCTYISVLSIYKQLYSKAIIVLIIIMYLFFYCETCTSVCRKEVYEALLEHLRCLQEIRTQEYVGMSVCQRCKQTFLLKFQTTSKHLLTAVWPYIMCFENKNGDKKLLTISRW